MLIRYVSTTSCPDVAVSSCEYRKLQVGSVTARREITIGSEVRNLFDEDPPYVNIAPSGNGSGGYDATAASPVGRMFAASLPFKI